MSTSFSFSLFSTKTPNLRQKIVVVEHRDHFFRIPRVNSDQNTLFSTKKKLEVGDFSSYQFCQLFSPFFTTTTTPLQIFQFCCKQIVAHRHEFVSFAL